LGGFLIQPYSYFVAVILSSLYDMLLILILMIVLLWLFQKSSLYPAECRINQLQFVYAFSLGIPARTNTSRYYCGLGLSFKHFFTRVLTIHCADLITAIFYQLDLLLKMKG